MKTLAISIALTSLLAGASAFAADANEQNDMQNMKYQVAAAPSKPERDAGKGQPGPDSSKQTETANTQPDPAFMPYVNDGHFDARQ